MGKTVKKLGSVVGLGSSATPKYQAAGQSYFDISKEVTPYATALKDMFEAQKRATAAGGQAQTDVLAQMGQAALGKGPSLAEQQMKAAQERSLAQSMAALQASRGGSAAANQRAMAMRQGSAGRDLAQAAAEARLAERDRFLQQQRVAEQAMMQGAEQALGTELKPKDLMREYEMQRVGAANKTAEAKAAETAKRRGALMGAIGAGLGAATGGAGGAAFSAFGKSMGGAYAGGKIVGQAPIDGDHPANDIVPAMLSPGEIVIPRTVAEKGPNAVKTFVQALEKRERKQKRKERMSYGDVLMACKGKKV